ncbi:MAG: hypothetical protein FWC13_00715 [Oscillospiraceae bacterium]|nr:hypothetical protein [Oscillospiraceae bacterium]
MKRTIINSSILFFGITALYMLVFIGSTYRITPNQLLIPIPLPSSSIIDLLVLCILPGLLTSGVYLWASSRFRQSNPEPTKSHSFLMLVLDGLPFAFLIAATVAAYTALRHSSIFTSSGFWGLVAPTGTTMVFPNTAGVWVTTIIIALMLAAVIYMFAPLFTFSRHKTPPPTHRFDKWLFYAAAAFIPSIPLFYLYNGNQVENHLVFSHILIVAGILAIVGMLLLHILKRATDRGEAALLLSILFWLCFWLFEAMYRAVYNIFVTLSSTVFMIILILTFAGLAILIRMFKPRFFNSSPVYKILTASLFVIFVFNLVPGINHEIILQRAIAADGEGENATFYIKRDFYTSDSLPTPDIYWVHLDGMMSMETVERFFGVSQNSLREELEYRGFLVYPNAELNAGSTRMALPALLSPAFYDSFFGELLDEYNELLTRETSVVVNDHLRQLGLRWDNISTSYELLTALANRQYDLTILNSMGGRMQLPSSFDSIAGDNVSVINFSKSIRDHFGDLVEMMNLTTPLYISDSHELIDDLRTVIVPQTDSDIEPVARFTFRAFNQTQATNFWRLDAAFSEDTEISRTRVDIYPMAYALITQSMLNYIDSVLNNNPNAVIVLQSDHGFHIYETQRYLLEQGYSLEQVLELIYSVFSAVRIPPEYGGLNAPIAPLNISRELVNRFVGENYELLP